MTENEFERLKQENKELQQENQLLHEILKSERDFFMEYFSYHVIEALYQLSCDSRLSLFREV